MRYAGGMELLIFRHGIAEDVSPSGDDARRRLTERGVERTAAAARGLATLIEPPDRVLTSPKTRARQTAEIAAGIFDRPVELVPVIAHGSAEAIREALAQRDEARLMVVGHEPTLGELVALLIGGRPGAGAVAMKKAGAAWLEADVDDGGGAGSARSRGVLRALLPPRVLRALAGEAK